MSHTLIDSLFVMSQGAKCAFFSPIHTLKMQWSGMSAVLAAATGSAYRQQQQSIQVHLYCRLPSNANYLAVARISC
jgi:hypothetical protein